MNSSIYFAVTLPLIVVVFCAGTDEKATSRVHDAPVPRHLQDFGFVAPEKFTGDVRYTRHQAVSPPGEPCREKLFVGKFACCWRLKEATTNRYSYYRWFCHSNPSTTNCENAKPPSKYDSWAREFKDPYACRRDVIDVELSLKFTIWLSTGDGSPLTLSVGDKEKLHEEVVECIADTMGVHKVSILVVEHTELAEDAGTLNSRYLTVTIRLVEDFVANMGNATDATRSPVTMHENGLSPDEKMRFTTNLAQSLQDHDGALSNTFVTRVDVLKQEEEVYGSAFADTAQPRAAGARYMCLLLISTMVAFSL